MWIFGASAWSWIRSASRLTLLCVVKSRHRGVQGPVELAGDVALEAAPDLLDGLAFGSAAGDAGAGGGAAGSAGGGGGGGPPGWGPARPLVGAGGPRWALAGREAASGGGGGESAPFGP